MPRTGSHAYDVKRARRRKKPENRGLVHRTLPDEDHPAGGAVPHPIFRVPMELVQLFRPRSADDDRRRSVGTGGSPW
jgi:hypothetical protein